MKIKSFLIQIYDVLFLLLAIQKERFIHPACSGEVHYREYSTIISEIPIQR